MCGSLGAATASDILVTRDVANQGETCAVGFVGLFAGQNGAKRARNV
jgi:hypothetical protein